MEKNELAKQIFNDINKLIYEIKRCKSKSMYNVLLIDYVSLVELCEEIGITDYPDLDDYSVKTLDVSDINILNAKKEILEKNGLYYKEISKLGTRFINKYDIDRNLRYENFLKSKISINDTIDLTYDFLKQFDKKILKSLENTMNLGRIIAVKQTGNKITDYGATYYSSGIFEPIIYINYEETLCDSATLIHENGHNFLFQNSSSLSNKIKIKREVNNFPEVLPHFLELVYYDYLKEMKIYADDVNILKRSYDATTAVNLENFNHILNKEIDLRKDYNEYSFIETYALGMTIAYYFYDNYLFDPEKTKDNIMKFIFNDGLYDIDYLLNSYGLKSDEIAKPYLLEKHFKNNTDNFNKRNH